MPYWHKYNPWRNKVVYVPIEELAKCVMYLGEQVATLHPLGVYILTPEKQLENWRMAGDKLDAYILPQPSGDHSMGIRYGKGDSEYLSPYGDRKKLSRLLKKYRS